MHLTSDEPFQRVSQSVGMIRIYFAVQFICFSIPYYFLWFISNCLGGGGVFRVFCFVCYLQTFIWGLFQNLLFYVLNKNLNSASITCLVRTAIELVIGSKAVKIKVIFNPFLLLLWKKCRAEPVQKNIRINLNCHSYP